MCKSTEILECDDLHVEKSLTASDIGRVPADLSADSSESNSQRQRRSTGWRSSLTSFGKPLILVACMSAFILEFSLWLPFAIPGVSSASIETYVPAGYHYDDEHTLFDNSSWTYNTDYALTAVMSCLAIMCLRATSPEGCRSKDAASLKLRMYSASLLICYGISTLAGGWSHQHFTTVDSLNSRLFRILWYICVGNVSFANCYMGLIGREVQEVFGVREAIPLGPWWFWPAYGSYMAAACALGLMSFKRPACDIFIAGITQFPPTFYCMGALGLRRWRAAGSSETPVGLVRLAYRVMYYVGFIGNAPLLPLYPLLVQYTNMSLAGINTLLHSWLMVTWGFQGVSLLHLCRAMSEYKPKFSKD